MSQNTTLAPIFGCARWWWNDALNQSIEVYNKTGKGLGQSPLNPLLSGLKRKYKCWRECYSQIFQATMLNLTPASQNFFEKRSREKKPGLDAIRVVDSFS